VPMGVLYVLIPALPHAFFLLALHPNLILRNNTPTGGDMGAHVWAPAFLRDHMLTQFKLSGWSMDWYSGLPAYRFYMVVPALAIVLLDLVLPYGIAFKLIVVAGLVLMIGPYINYVLNIQIFHLPPFTYLLSNRLI